MVLGYFERHYLLPTSSFSLAELMCIVCQKLFILTLLWSMGAVSERKKQIRSFADVADRVGLPSSDVAYNQLGFEGLESVESKEVTIENLQVAKLPLVKKGDNRIEWSCSVSYQPDLWHQEDYGELVLHALHNADAAIALRLKPHDLVQVTGVPWDQRIELRRGTVKTI